jgi:predicted amidohydrolase
MPLVAACQMTSGPEKARNLDTAERLVREAARRGAELVGLPETFPFMGPDHERAANAEPADGPTLTRFSKLARELKIHLVAGSILEAGGPGGRFYNTSVLLGPDGQRVAAYRKIHLFDVEIGDGAKYRESEAVAPGAEVVCAETPLGKVGLSVCYDLRFPELYRQLSAKGAQFLFVPAAFTQMTGKDHWEVLLRARAIENQCFVIAPAQFGQHSEKRVTYGHAMVVDPWGLVLARAAEGEGVAVAEANLGELDKVRQKLPALQHRRL